MIGYRLRAMLAAGAALLAQVTATPAMAEEVVLRPAPDSKWVVHYGAASCRLLRDFGTGEGQVAMFVEQFAPGRNFMLVLAGTPLDEYVDDRQVSLSFGPADGPLGERQIQWLSSSLGQWDPALTIGTTYLTPPPPPTDDPASAQERDDWFSVMAIPAAETAQLDRVELRSGRDHLRLEVPRLGEALQTLNECSQARLTEWGLDRDTQLTLTRRAAPDNLRQVTRAIQSAYPLRALMSREQANLHVRMIVDEAGGVSDCTVTDMTQTQNITTGACDEFAGRAQFQPALDATGQPVKSFYSTQINYRVSGPGNR